MSNSHSDMSKKIVVVTNATAKNQGRPVCQALSEAGYQIRALTRNKTSPGAIALQEYKNLTLIECDPNSLESIDQAFKGGSIVVANSVPDDDEGTAPPGAGYISKELGEFEQGKRYADAAKKHGASILVWSTLPDAKKISNGKYGEIRHFQNKVRVEEYMNKIDLPVTFLCPGMFMENFHNYEIVSLQDDQLVMDLPRATTNDVKKWPHIYMTADYGRLITLLIENYDAYQLKHRKTIASLPPCSTSDMIQTLTKLTGKSVDLKSNSCAFAEGSDYDQMMLYAMDPSLNYFEPQDVEHTIKFFQDTGFKLHSFEDFVNEKLKPALGL